MFYESCNGAVNRRKFIHATACGEEHSNDQNGEGQAVLQPDAEKGAFRLGTLR
jgi:hypothetical protein